MSEIPPQAVAERRTDPEDDLVVVDVRPEAAFEDWHVPGSENVPVYEDLKDDPESAAERLAQLPEDAEIVTVCGVGKMAAVATDLLREMGYHARTMTDGLRGWSRVHRTASIPVGGGEVVQVVRPGTGCLSYVLVSDGEAAVVDPSQYAGVYEEVLRDAGATLTAVLETHAHADHVSGARAIAEGHEVPYYLHPADAGALDSTTRVGDGTTITVGSLTVEALHTPGHTDGSVTFVVGDEALVTGDTLFLDSVGRPDLEGGDEAVVRERAGTLYDSLDRVLAAAAPEAAVLPAHEPGAPEPPTTATLETVLGDNAVLDHERDGFVDTVTDDVPETPPNHGRIKRANVGRTTLDADEAREVELGPNKCAAD